MVTTEAFVSDSTASEEPGILYLNIKGSDKFRNFLFLIDPNTLLEFINTHKSLI